MSILSRSGLLLKLESIERLRVSGSVPLASFFMVGVEDSVVMMAAAVGLIKRIELEDDERSIGIVDLKLK